MATKISGFDNTPVAPVGAGKSVQRAKGASANAAQGAVAEDGDIQITGTARQLANIEQAVREAPVINEARVTQLRTAIEQGTYAVRPEHIAGQLAQMEQALGRLPDESETDSAGTAPQSRK
ncbi:MAG TPA: flagellar biosynthesis anti-sigma factor FlgM [Steroidobacteraceae bacterium]